MKVFRIVAARYSHELTASGRPGRWNLSDQFTIYCSESRALATLELLVNRSGIQPVNQVYKVLEIELPDEYDEVELAYLPENWRGMLAYPQLQQVGSRWYKEEKSLVLKVPSAVIPQESNYIINTRHIDFERKAVLTGVEDYFWDSGFRAFL